MMMVVDHVSPWLTPSSTFANTTQPHDGAQMSRSGTGTPTSQPATSTGLRPKRSESVPAKKLVIAFVTPNATMNVSVAVRAVRPNTSSARSGRIVRSWPIIPPTSALTATRSENCARFSRRPSRTNDELVVTYAIVAYRAGARCAEASAVALATSKGVRDAVRLSVPAGGARPQNGGVTGTGGAAFGRDDDVLVAEVVLRIAADHAEVPGEVLEALVRESLVPTANAPVTMYRAVLAERRVRTRLRGTPRSGVLDASGDAGTVGARAWNATYGLPPVTT